MPSPQDREWRQVVVALDLEQARLDQYRADTQARLDAYASDAAARTAEMLQAHRDRVRQFEEDQRAWFKSLYDGDEPAPTDVGQQEPSRQGASSRGPATPAGPRPAGQPINPHAAELAELAEAERIKGLSMEAFAVERQRLIRPNQGMF
jgi:hypothetical protein